jgi:hypothetical protein
MEVKETLITPAIAESILLSNKSNRPPKPEIISRYRKEMENGRWKESTGELIKISKTGVLIDGQHRLMALALAGISIKFHIAYDLEDNIFDVIDSGSLRSAKDSLAISGVLNAAAISKIITCYNRVKKGRFYRENKGVSLTNNEVLSIYNDRPEFWQTVYRKSRSWSSKFSTILPISIIGGFYACFFEKSEEKANDFFDQLCELQGTKFPAIVSLKKKLMDAKVIKTQQLTIHYKYAIIIKAWNKFRTNDLSVRINYDPQNEKYPEIL